jgi:hypothetical protein
VPTVARVADREIDVVLDSGSVRVRSGDLDEIRGDVAGADFSLQ